MGIFSGRAQGTIEYLVIVAIVVVLGLVVVGLLSGVGDVSELSSNISGVSSKTGSGGISVTEAVADVDNGVLVLSNVSGEPLTVTSISAGGESNPYSKTIFLGEKSSFVLNSVGSSCLCSSGDVRKSCDYVVTYRTADGLVKTTTIAVSNECVSVATAVSGTNPNDLTAPVVALSSPVDDVNVFSKTVSFVFSVTEANTISSCTLRAGGDANNYTGITAGSNTISYTFSNDKLVDWNISCTDASNNIGTSTTRTLDVDSNAYQVTTCLELQEMNNDLAGNYELMNNIDCSDTVNWNSGAGFDPIGDCGVINFCLGFLTDNIFTGSLNGNYYTINGLYINNPTLSGAGLFANSSGTISNLKLVDVDINAYQWIGGIAGYADRLTLSKVGVSGTLYGIGYVGGLIGRSNESLNISQSYSGGSIYGTMSVGGLAGQSEFGTIANSYSYASIIEMAQNSGQYRGGLVGYGHATIVTNSYATGAIIGGFTGQGGFFGYQAFQSASDSFSTGNVPTYFNDYGGFSGLVNNSVRSNVYWYKPEESTLNCYSGGNTGCVSKDDITWFYTPSNAPMSAWDFDTIWTARDNNYPALAWE